MPQCVASAPGKVLVAGGYLVLLRPNVGIVVGMSARFTARVAGTCKCDFTRAGLYILLYRLYRLYSKFVAFNLTDKILSFESDVLSRCSSAFPPTSLPRHPHHRHIPTTQRYTLVRPSSSSKRFVLYRFIVLALYFIFSNIRPVSTITSLNSDTPSTRRRFCSRPRRIKHAILMWKRLFAGYALLLLHFAAVEKRLPILF